MERMAERGTLYRNAYCPSPLCMPSRSAFMAGKRVHELQAYSNCTLRVPGGHPAYGQMLAEQGVHTVYIGKTDVFAPGEELGFSELFLPKDRKAPGDKHIGRRPLTIRHGAAKRAERVGVHAGAFDEDEEVMARALLWLAATAPHISQQPWTLTINLTNPHPPFWNTSDVWERAPGGDLPRIGADQPSAQHRYARELRNHFETHLYTEEQVRNMRRAYYGKVDFVDRQLGRLIDELDRSGMATSTNLIYVSDHGEMLGKFGLWWKSSLYEDSVRIPCLAMGPDFEPGREVMTPVDLHDVQASLFRAASGAARPPDWIGTPLQDIPPDDPERVVFSEYHGHGCRSGAYMIRNRDWKLIYCMEAPHQLFHLANDPEELHDVFTDFPHVAVKLEEQLRRICSPELENEKAHAFQTLQLDDLRNHYE